MTLHVSPNRLEGSLCDTSLDRLLAECRKHLVTGALHIRLGSKKGIVELRAGAIDHAAFGGTEGDRALEQLRRLPDGLYELTQCLPDLDGALGSSAALIADGDLELIAVMRHCEDHALSCTIRVSHAGRHGSIEYRAGEILAARAGGETDVDAIVAMKAWRTARIEVVARPLDLDIDGWPSVGRAPTAPFTLRDQARLARGTGSVDALLERSGDGTGDRRKATVAAPPPPPRAAAALPRPRRALPPSAPLTLEPQAAPPVPLPRLPDAGPIRFSPRAPTAVRGSATATAAPRPTTQPRLEAARRPKPSSAPKPSQAPEAAKPPRKPARPRSRKRAGRAAPPAAARTPVVPATPFPGGPPPAHARVSSSPMSAPTASRSRPSLSHPAAVEGRQLAAAAAYRSPRPIARRLAPPTRPPEVAARPRPATQLHRSFRWVPLAVVLSSVALASAAAFALLSGVI